jgi:hypothetical protein
MNHWPSKPNSRPFFHPHRVAPCGLSRILPPVRYAQSTRPLDCGGRHAHVGADPFPGGDYCAETARGAAVGARSGSQPGVAHPVQNQGRPGIARDHAIPVAWRAAVVLVPEGQEKDLAEELAVQLGRGDRQVQLSLTTSSSSSRRSDVDRPQVARWASRTPAGVGVVGPKST